MPKRITQQQLQDFANSWKRLHHSYEQKNFRVFKKALDAQIKPVVEEIKIRGVVGIESILPLLVSREPLQAAYKECYVKVGVAHAQWQSRKIKEFIKAATKASPFQFLSERWKNLMQSFYESQSSQRIVDVTDTTIKRIQQLLSQSRADNLTISQQSDFMVKELSSSDFNRARALRISRTESTAGANQGASLAAADSDYLLNKQWLSIIDEVTRPSHVAANKQTVGINEKFTVGGHECDHPGDLSLPAEEVVNCRCTVAYVPVFDSDGLPILK